MAARWTLDEKQQLWDFIAEQYVEGGKTIHWKEVETHMREWGYQRTSEACRKRYNVMLDEKADEIQEANESLGSFASTLCESLKPMSEVDWQVENLHDTVDETPEIEEILLDEKECDAEYTNPPPTVYENEIEDYYEEEKKKILYLAEVIAIIVVFLLFYWLFTK